MTTEWVYVVRDERPDSTLLIGAYSNLEAAVAHKTAIEQRTVETNANRVAINRLRVFDRYDADGWIALGQEGEGDG